MKGMLRWVMAGIFIAVLFLLTRPEAYAQDGYQCLITVQRGASIQKAIDQAPPGSVVCVPEGVWHENIIIDKHIVLKGAGLEKTLIKGTEEGYPVIWINGPSEGESIVVRLEGLSVSEAKGNCADIGICANGILVRGRSDVTVLGCAVSGNAAEGIRLFDVAQVQIQNSTFSDNDAGVWVGDSAKATIQNCETSDNLHGFVIADQAQANIVNCNITTNHLSGIWLFDSAQATIRSCTISDNHDGIMLWNQSRAIIESNWIFRNEGYGVALKEAPCFNTSWQFRGSVTGKGNYVPGADKPGGNQKGAFCPAELAFLADESITPPPAVITGGRTSCMIVVQPGESIQDAIGRAAPNTVICLTPGRWEENLRIEKSILLQGGGEGKTEIIGKAEGQPVIWIKSPEGGLAPLVRIEGVAILGATYSETLGPDSRPHGVLVQGTARLEISNCKIWFNDGAGIFLSDSVQAVIRDSTISQNGDGIMLSDSAQATIERNLIEKHFSGYGIFSSSNQVVQGYGNQMHDNAIDLGGNLSGALRQPLVPATEKEIIWPNPGYPTIQHAVDALLPGGKLILKEGNHNIAGVTITKEVSIQAERGTTVILGPTLLSLAAVVSVVGDAKLTLVGVQLRHADVGILLGSEAQAKVVQSNIRNNGEGLKLLGSAEVEINSSTIEENGDGILLIDSSRLLISDSVISNNGRGINCMDSAQAELDHCSIKLNHTGVSLEGDSPQARIKDSNFSDNDFDVCLHDAATAFVTNSVFSHSKIGILIINQSRATITGANFTGGPSDFPAGLAPTGVWIADSGRATITGSSFSRAPVLLEDSARAEIVNCEISEGGGGVILAGSSWAGIKESHIFRNAVGIDLKEKAQAEIAQATISENATVGISCADSSYLEIRNSTVSSNRVGGILLSDSCYAIIEGNSIVKNGSYGVALYDKQCFKKQKVFVGLVKGGRNNIPGPEEPNGNGDIGVCPWPALSFLMTTSGGSHRGR